MNITTNVRVKFCYPHAVVICEIKNYFSLRRRPSEIILPEIILQNYFRGLLQLMNIFQHIQCRGNKIISAGEIVLE